LDINFGRLAFVSKGDDDFVLSAKSTHEGWEPLLGVTIAKDVHHLFGTQLAEGAATLTGRAFGIEFNEGVGTHQS
jgi:hypothetical protein